MKLIPRTLPYLTLLIFALSTPSLLGVIYFNTGLSPDGGDPSIWGVQTGTFTPAHDMIIDQALSYYVPNTQAAGYIGSIEFFMQGVQIAQGIGSGFVGGQQAPAVFSQPVFLSAGVTYGIEVDTGGYLDLFHSSQISTPDGLISNISAVDANNHKWVAFPSLVLSGPVPEPSTLSLALVFSLAFANSRKSISKRK